ncbi:MAG: EthD domain-containing protein [Novosphingobium sp.]|nr:EthD domain-containing protein [Novosphingobium sp.]
MPIKKLVMVKRKPGLTPEQFRDGYENSHSRIAVRLFGHLWLEYRRNYLQTGYNFTNDEGNADVIGFDAISEFILPDEAALEEMNRISMENIEMIKEDEAKWFDQSRCWIVNCETFVEEGLAGARQGAVA